MKLPSQELFINTLLKKIEKGLINYSVTQKYLNISVLQHHAYKTIYRGSKYCILKMQNDKDEFFAVKFYFNPFYYNHDKDRNIRFSAFQNIIETLKPGYLNYFEYGSFKFVSQEIGEENKFDNNIYITKWIDGISLKQHLLELAKKEDKKGLEILQQQFILFASEILKNDKFFAHGKISADNILVQGNKLILTGLDTAFTPDILDCKATGIVDTSINHPNRKNAIFNSDIDHFALLILLINITALCSQPKLVKNFTTGNGLLFCADDYIDTSKSKTVEHLLQINAPYLNHLIKLLQMSTSSVEIGIPLLKTYIHDTPATITNRKKEIAKDYEQHNLLVQATKEGVILKKAKIEASQKVKNVININSKIKNTDTYLGNGTIAQAKKLKKITVFAACFFVSTVIFTQFFKLGRVKKNTPLNVNTDTTAGRLKNHFIIPATDSILTAK